MTKYQELKNKALSSPEARALHELEVESLIQISATLKALDARRIELDLTKRELADLVGLEPSSVRRLLSGQAKNPTLSTVTKLLSALGSEFKMVNVSTETNRTSQSQAA